MSPLCVNVKDWCRKLDGDSPKIPMHNSSSIGEYNGAIEDGANKAERRGKQKKSDAEHNSFVTDTSSNELHGRPSPADKRPRTGLWPNKRFIFMSRFFDLFILLLRQVSVGKFISGGGGVHEKYRKYFSRIPFSFIRQLIAFVIVGVFLRVQPSPNQWLRSPIDALAYNVQFLNVSHVRSVKYVNSRRVIRQRLIPHDCEFFLSNKNGRIVNSSIWRFPCVKRNNNSPSSRAHDLVKGPLPLNFCYENIFSHYPIVNVEHERRSKVMGKR
ncbi:hypothetical protein GHT06_016369 [Daphnia sinensis]|uniref:Uncharacterized protein n=1 Tax=Daphnia sinensis TaxID=1820382 RepID=A0AAD5KNG6_9CRUS|nr:hypothetical protein GHT06_016369 [Daphnia sinensis]